MFLSSVAQTLYLRLCLAVQAVHVLLLFFKPSSTARLLRLEILQAQHKQESPHVFVFIRTCCHNHCCVYAYQSDWSGDGSEKCSPQKVMSFSCIVSRCNFGNIWSVGIIEIAEQMARMIEVEINK